MIGVTNAKGSTILVGKPEPTVGVAACQVNGRRGQGMCGQPIYIYIYRRICERKRRAAARQQRRKNNVSNIIFFKVVATSAWSK